MLCAGACRCVTNSFGFFRASCALWSMESDLRAYYPPQVGIATIAKNV
jgi:hypothetical protein